MTANPKTIAILGGDPVVGQTLELLLSGASHVVRFLAEPVVGKPGELLAGVGLLLLAPALSAGCRETFLEAMLDTQATAKIPVLEMLTASAVASGAAMRTGPGGYVLWPCGMEELKKEIDARLSGDPEEHGRETGDGGEQEDRQAQPASGR